MRLSKLSETEFEDLCDGCGKCCGFMNAKSFACPGLDCATNRCTVYARRHDTYMCTAVTPENTLDLHERGILPASCAYVRYEKGLSALDRPVEAAVLIPFSLAPRDFQRKYRKANKAYLRSRRASLARPQDPAQSSQLSDLPHSPLAQFSQGRT